jgi:hypothetical protein
MNQESKPKSLTNLNQIGVLMQETKFKDTLSQNLAAGWTTVEDRKSRRRRLMTEDSKLNRLTIHINKRCYKEMSDNSSSSEDSDPEVDNIKINEDLSNNGDSQKSYTSRFNAAMDSKETDYASRRT